MTTAVAVSLTEGASFYIDWLIGLEQDRIKWINLNTVNHVTFLFSVQFRTQSQPQSFSIPKPHLKSHENKTLPQQ